MRLQTPVKEYIVPNITWYLQRLTAMTPPELFWRGWRFVRTKQGAVKNWPKVSETYAMQPTLWNRIGKTCRFGMFYPNNDIDTNPPVWGKNCLAEAARLLDHRFSFFALSDEFLGEQLNWNRDYKNGVSLPLVYAPYLDFRDFHQVGDVKYVWEINRHHHLVRLGQAYTLTGNSRFAREIVIQIRGWINQCPYMQGVNWTSPMENSIRVMNWAVALDAIRNWEEMPADFPGLVAISVNQHLDFVDSHYSLFSSANNHLIAEAAGVYVAASFWGKLPKSHKWRERARKHLLRECLRQTWTDGVGKEQTFGYQFFVWDLFLFSALVASRSGKGTDFSNDYRERLERMAEFLVWVGDCQGNIPHVGDEDDGYALQLMGPEEPRLPAMLHVAARFFDRPEFALWAGDNGTEKARWLFAAEGHQHKESVKNKKLSAIEHIKTLRSNRLFAEGGYSVFRAGTSTSDEVVSVFDCGPHGWPKTAVHAHADALSLTMSFGGHPLFIDPGTFSYQDNEWRHFFKATAQHNTLCFGDRDQAEYLNRFMWGKKPEVHMDGFKSDLEGNAAIQGAVIWACGAVHTRGIEWIPKESHLDINDTWKGPEPPLLNFMIAPGYKAELTGNEVVFFGKSAPDVRLHCEAGDISVEPVKISPRYYVLEDTVRIRIALPEAEGNVLTRIEWRNK